MIRGGHVDVAILGVSAILIEGEELLTLLVGYGGFSGW